MPIETIEQYNPKYNLPIFPHTTNEKFNDYKVGKEYEFRIEDGDMAETEHGDGTYSWPFDAILLYKHKTTVEEMSPALIGVCTNTASKSDALNRIGVGSDPVEMDDEILLTYFLRIDAAEDWVMSDAELINPPKSTSEYY